ncbi:MAG TPA: acyl carrier protein [Rhizomicrobium sp.]|nr:acyl carrier protein [Rhizomicrobium sp.]
MAVDKVKFRNCIVRGLKLRGDEYRADLKIGDIEQWDSVAHLDLMAEIELEFGVRFDLDEITTLTSLPELLSRLEKA